MENVVSSIPAGRVEACWRYPVKSLQGLSVDTLAVDPKGIDGDRVHGLIDVGSGHLLSAKRIAALLMASADDHAITLPDGRVLSIGDPSIDAELSTWLDRPVRLVASHDAGDLSFEMTFDPPDDEAEYYEIPAYPGTLLDSAAVHVITRATLDACASARPDIDWDERRFRPNVVVDVDVEPFGEQAWIGHEVAIGGTVLSVAGPMVRCAMPLRAQPGGLERQPALFKALSELNAQFPNHLGLACEVVESGSIAVGDEVALA